MVQSLNNKPPLPHKEVAGLMVADLRGPKAVAKAKAKAKAKARGNRGSLLRSINHTSTMSSLTKHRDTE